ncbi:winged helix-turn-helix transcriptional regulator [Microbispora bryophytorum]|uniref:Transcriptional regulator n=1 Tax=Microbispora bryophytorum TaxID=1460882 RepID=A0A8H9H250_9ACTN|nr:winged helix-turn-helix transcriptional regulator [Microbispora bryophytorum]MBD3136286.1 transcriptional regulator [Microbispora bryophytorum]TQS08011.1 transcriptional regulator [Microbispora bryophytorum]GGO05470.1 transcriptional regulator [Microbispora bryophytorum]
MSTARTYGDPCATARALDLLGERWALMIVRDLLFGPKRYSDLQSGLPNASPTVLSQRLRDLEEGGVIRRRRLGPPARAWVYELTEWGHDLEPILVHLGRWGRHSPLKETTTPLGTDSLMLAVKSHLEPARLGDLDATFLVDVGGDVFTLRVSGGELAIRRGEPDRQDAALRTDPAVLKALVIDGTPLDQAGEPLEITGDRAAFQRLLDALATD